MSKGGKLRGPTSGRPAVLMMPKPNSPQAFEPRKVGRYLLHREIAHGGMATVHVGRLLGQVGFSRTVAIKRMHEHCARDPDFVSMFIDEARLAARIRHPNVVPTLDVVVLDGELFLVMEYVQGETLARLIRRSVKVGQRAAPRVVSSVIAGLLEGLHAAHEAVGEHGEPLGIVHRDVSPQNVMVGNDGVARVLDFGVAKASNRLQTTRDGQLKGKIEYMAPEQIRGSLVDRRTDVYSAACCLWEMLAGRRLYTADNSVALWGKVFEGNPDPPSSLNSDVSRDLDEITMQGLEADPTKRYQTAEAMAIALEQTVGIATPREVGRWVQALAGKKLRERAELVAELDSVATDFPVSQEDEVASCVSSVSSKASGSGTHVPGPRPPEVSRPARSSGVALTAVPGPKPSPAGGVSASGPMVPAPQQIEPAKPEPLKSPGPEPPKPPRPEPPKPPRPEPPKPPRPEPPKPSRPEPPKPDAPVVPKPNAPVVPKPDAPVVPKPDAPVVPKPDEPVVPKPDAPVVPKPDAPVVPKPDEPVVPKSDEPVVSKPDEPVVPKLDAPVVPKPDAPVVPKPDAPVVSKPDAPVVPKPDEPVVSKPDAPVVPKPDEPVVPKPDEPVVSKPDAPVVPKPDAPVVPKPDAPVVPKPDAPVVTKPDLPPETSHAPLSEAPHAPPPDAPREGLESGNEGFVPFAHPSMADDMDVAVPMRRSPIALILGLVVVFALIGGGLLYASSGSDDTPTDLIPVPVPEATVPAPPQPVEGLAVTAALSVTPPESKKVRLRLAVSPATGKVLIDGVEHEQREVALDVSRKAVKVMVEAPGYVTMERQFVPEADGELVFELKRVVVAPKPTATVEIRGPVETEL